MKDIMAWTRVAGRVASLSWKQPAAITRVRGQSLLALDNFQLVAAVLYPPYTHWVKVKGQGVGVARACRYSLAVF